MSENHDALLYILRIVGFLFAVCCVWLIYACQTENENETSESGKPAFRHCSPA